MTRNMNMHEHNETVSVFLYEGERVRTAGSFDRPLFVAKDVCGLLGIEKHRDAVARLDEDERESVVVDTLGGPQSTAAVTESGLYHLVFRSRKAAAGKFRRWVTGEVLPELRKRGFYKALGGRELITLPEWLAVQGVDVRRERRAAKRLLKKAWEAAKLMGYRDKRTKEENGLVMFPQEVLDLADDGELERLEMREPAAQLSAEVLERMVPGREYSVDGIAALGGLSGSEAKVRSDVGALMKPLVGMNWHGARVERVKRARRNYFVINTEEEEAS